MPLTNFFIDRYKDWKKNTYPNKKKLLEILEKAGQKPKAMIISCCDSRVNSSKIFLADDGEFFIHRNIANLVPSFKSEENFHETFAAIEYGVKVLKIKDLIILGHSSCGGITHAHDIFSGKIQQNSSSLDKWIQIIKPAYKKLDKNHSKDKRIKSLEKQSIINSISNLKDLPVISEALLKNKLNIHGLWFEIQSGNIMYYNQKINKFQSLY